MSEAPAFPRISVVTTTITDDALEVDSSPELGDYEVLGMLVASVFIQLRYILNPEEEDE